MCSFGIDFVSVEGRRRLRRLGAAVWRRTEAGVATLRALVVVDVEYQIGGQFVANGYVHGEALQPHFEHFEGGSVKEIYEI